MVFIWCYWGTIFWENHIIFLYMLIIKICVFTHLILYICPEISAYMTFAYYSNINSNTDISFEISSPTMQLKNILKPLYFSSSNGIFIMKVKVKVSPLCRTLCDSMDYTVHGILQARILSRGSSWPRDQTQVFHVAGRFFTSWATREAHFHYSLYLIKQIYLYTLSSLCSTQAIWFQSCNEYSTYICLLNVEKMRDSVWALMSWSDGHLEWLL